MLDERNHMAELHCDPLLRAGLDERLNGLERRDLGPPALCLLEGLAQRVEDHPRPFDGCGLDQRVDRRGHRGSDGLALVHGERQQRGEEGEERGFDTGAKGLAYPLDQDGRGFALVPRFRTGPDEHDVDDPSLLDGFEDARGLFQREGNTVGDGLGVDVGWGGGERGELGEEGGLGQRRQSGSSDGRHGGGVGWCERV